MYEYRVRPSDNAWELYEPGKDNILNVILPGEKFAIGFSGLVSGEYVLHKHGSHELVNAWLTKTVQKFMANKEVPGAIDMAKDLAVISDVIEKWDVHTVNRILDTTGYLAIFMNERGAELLAGLGNEN